MWVLLKNPWVQAGLLIASLYGAMLLFDVLSPVLVPLFFAFLVAYSFDPLIDFFEERKMARMPAILLLMFVLVSATVLAPMFLLPSMVQEGQELIQGAQVPKTPDLVDRALQRLPLEYWMRQAGWLAPETTEFDARQVISQRLGNWVDSRAGEFLKLHAQELLGAGKEAGSTAAELVGLVATRVLNTLLMFGNFVLFMIVSIYLMKDYDHIVARADELVPPRSRPTARRIFSQIDIQLRAWLRGQAFVCLFLAAMYVVGFTISGVPFGAVLGLFGGAISFVPFLGLAVTIGPVVLLTLLKFGLDWHIAAALGTFAVAQFLEGNVITPRIMGQQVGLSPVWVILAIMVFGSTLGFAGLLLAVPTAAVLKVLIVECIELYRNSSFYSPPATLIEANETVVIIREAE